jgi:ABC-2 type transport system ATP-binding protein
VTVAASAPAVELRGVTKRYGEFVAVGDLTLTVPSGTIYGILGPNGAGKTTTLRMINDIMAPDAGSISLLGGLRPGRQAAARIGYLPEERGLYAKMQVGELVRFFGELRGLSGADARARGERWLERLGVADWQNKKVQDLSKGMQQKVQFATAVVHEPELLILDEPWSGLDPINAGLLREIVLEQRAAGRTILFSTHLMEQAEQLCEHLCIIARGAKVLEGELRAIKRQAAKDRTVLLALADDAALAGAETTLADRALVAARRGPPDRLEIELAPDASADRLLERLVAAGIRLRRFEVVEPSLHQIFLDRVGGAAGSEIAGRTAAGDARG